MTNNDPFDTYIYVHSDY